MITPLVFVVSLLSLISLIPFICGVRIFIDMGRVVVRFVVPKAREHRGIHMTMGCDINITERDIRFQLRMVTRLLKHIFKFQICVKVCQISAPEWTLIIHSQASGINAWCNKECGRVAQIRSRYSVEGIEELIEYKIHNTVV
ncbi:hypothetical protein P692DRAFT_20821493 [Suillus brevipes Sb2]|nr:hypothetical protein P692DRAFT_20821493 [Suillus brevipes Sb2]